MFAILCAGILFVRAYLVESELRTADPVPPARHFHPRNLLIFAPHNDDETLGTGGLIGQAVRGGADVHIVLMTNGDGFKFAEALAFRDLIPSPRDLVEFGYVRQRETLAATGHLGLPKKDVVFLGYPDRGLSRFWAVNWSPDRLFTSRYTKVDHSPYRNSFHQQAPYCGASAIDDIKTVLRIYHPSEVFIPHSLDAHPDHYSTHNIALYAIEELRRDAPDLTRKMHVQNYLVHRGNWPRPRGYHPGRGLLPPRTFRGLGISWWRYLLRSETEIRKEEAIRRYRTQMRVMSRYLQSFARRNELFADEPFLSAAPPPSGVMRIDGNVAEDWSGIAPAIVDPVGDTILRDLETGGDLKAAYFAADAKYIYARIETTKDVRRTVVYRILMKPIDPKPFSTSRAQINIEIYKLTTAEVQWTETARRRTISRTVPPGIRFRFRNRDIEIAIPRTLTGDAHRFFLDAYTLYRDRVQIDALYAGPIGIPEVGK